MEWLKELEKSENFELYVLLFLLLFTVWFIGNTVMFYKGEKRKVKNLHRHAKEGEVDSQNKLAKRYQKGNMVKKDCSKAAFWYQQAAFEGDKVAKGHLQRFLDREQNSVKRKKC